MLQGLDIFFNRSKFFIKFYSVNPIIYVEGKTMLKLQKLINLRNKIELGKYSNSKKANKIQSHEALRFIPDGDVIVKEIG